MGHPFGRFAVWGSVTPSEVRARTLRHNVQSKVPHGAAFVRLDSVRGKHATCDGCCRPIDREEVSYALEFRRDAQTVKIKLHRECWESWRILQGARSRQTLPCRPAFACRTYARPRSDELKN